MILAGTFTSDQLSVWEKVFVLSAATGVILAAIYMLHAVLKMFWGPLDKKENSALSDLNWREVVALLPLVVLVFVMGLFPRTLLDSIEPSATQMISDYHDRWEADWHDDTPRLLPFPELQAQEVEVVEADAEGGGAQ